MKFHHILVLLTAILLVGCNSKQPAAKSPGDVLKQYVAASQKQDIAAMKSLLSKGSLALIEKSAKTQNTTTDELLRREASVKIQNAPETGNEKIEGETATVEVKNETNGEFDMKMPFVREDGAWKIARDKYIEELLEKATEEVNKKPTNSSFSNSNSAVNK
ncbi:MAG: nuclear transport factor 2 family protein [Actinomycetota bacterium]